jgi:hypothetical protein
VVEYTSLQGSWRNDLGLVVSEVSNERVLNILKNAQFRETPYCWRSRRNYSS